MKASVLVVDDEAGVRAALTGVLKDEGYEVETAPSGEACLEATSRRAYDAILLDVWLPGMDGLDTLAALRQRRVDAEVIVISGHGNVESAVRAIKMGAFDFVEKPLSLDKTMLVVRNALRQRNLEAENRALRATSSLPVPFSPRISTRPLVGAAIATCSRRWRIGGLSPTIVN